MPRSNSVFFDSKWSVLSTRPKLPLDRPCCSANKDHCHCGFSCFVTTFVVFVIDSLNERKQHKPRGGRRQPWAAAGGRLPELSWRWMAPVGCAHVIVKTEPWTLLDPSKCCFPGNLRSSELPSHWCQVWGRKCTRWTWDILKARKLTKKGFCSHVQRILKPTWRSSHWTIRAIQASIRKMTQLRHRKYLKSTS